MMNFQGLVPLCLVLLFVQHTVAVEIQRPYNVPEDQRYSYVNGIHKMWVYKTDKPHSPDSQTHPRTEIRIKFGNLKDTDMCQKEQLVHASCKIFGGSPSATTYKGSLSYYRNPTLLHNIYSRWFRLNAIYDADANKVQVYMDGDLKFETTGRGGDSHFFTCGVYAQNNDSNYLESRWKNIKTEGLILTDPSILACIYRAYVP